MRSRWPGVVAAALTLATAAPPAARAQVRTGAYVARQAGVEITRETFRFDGSGLAAQVDIPHRNLRLETQTAFTPRLSPLRYQATVRSPSGSSVLQHVDVSFADTVKWTIRAGTATNNGSTAIKRPYTMLQNLMFSQLAVALLRYNRVSGGTQVLDVWLPEGGRVAQLRMSFTGDSGQVDLSGVTFHVKTDAGGWLRSLTVPAQALSVEWHERLPPLAPAPRGTADTLAPATARESEVTFASGDLSLGGTLTVPARASGRIPVVLIVAGSGPTDRNGNSGSIRSNMYAQLAWRLAERGVASLRYDKRGLGATRARVAPATLTLADFAADVVSGVRFLRADPRFGAVAIVGHSEGAWLAIRAANSGAPVSGVALLAGLGRGIGDVLGEQLAFQLDSAAAREFATLFPRYLAGDDIGTVPDRLQPLLLPVNRGFMKTIAAFDARAEIARLRVPVLLVQGDADTQVSVRDAELLKAARPEARLVMLPGANHLFKSATSRDRMVQLALYLDPTLPIVAQLPESLARWVRDLR